MIRKLILSHGPLAAEILRAAEKIAGPMPEFTALCLEWDESSEQSRKRTEEALRDLSGEAGDTVLILSDIFGGTPHNVGATFCRSGEVEMVTGFNLPMVVRLGCHCNGELGLEELAKWIQGKGRSSICTTGDCHRQPPSPAEDLQRAPRDD